MTDLKYVQELLNTAKGTQGSLLIPRKISDALFEEVDKFLIPRSEAALYIGPNEIPGSSYDLNRTTPDSMDVRVVAEGAEVPLDQTEYTNLNILPVKYGVAVRITRELLEDAKWNLLEHNIKYAGKRLAENENSLVVTALDEAANTVSGGAAITVPNITAAMQFLEDSDFNPTTFFIGTEVLTDLRNIDLFVNADKFGSNELVTNGFVGRILGMNVIKVSTNAGMTKTSSYVSDRTQAYILVEKRPVTIENFELASHDMSGAVLTQRITAAAIRTSAIAKITTT